MFKIFLTFCFAIACLSECTYVKYRPYAEINEFGPQNDQFEISEKVISADGKASDLGLHVMDFLKLMDVEKMTAVAMQYLHDPEVLTFMKFLFSPEFKNLIWDFESIEEFKEAVTLLTSKGYDVESVLDSVNAFLNLPPYEKPHNLLRNEKGISGFFEAMLATLPLEEMKELFEMKLQTIPEIAELFETVNSQEFMDIMKRMRENPKFMEFKIIFEGYGFDFKFLCNLIKEIFGDYYQGIFCE